MLRYRQFSLVRIVSPRDVETFRKGSDSDGGVAGNRIRRGKTIRPRRAPRW